MSYSCFTHLSTGGRLGCFHILVIVNDTATNIGVPSDMFSEVGYLGLKADPFLIFWGISILLSTVAVPVCIPTSSARRFPFLHILPALFVCWCTDDGHSDRCEVIPQSWRDHNTEHQTILQSHCGQNSLVLAQEQAYRSTEQNRQPRSHLLPLFKLPWVS